MKAYSHLINTVTKGSRCDITPLFADYKAFSQVIADLSISLTKLDFDCVAGIDALGFILGTGIALHFKKGLLAIRKGGKLPVNTEKAIFVDYTGFEKTLEIQTNAIKSGSRILIVDEWIETGNQVKAAIELIERQKGIVAGIATLNVDISENTQKLINEIPCFSIWKNADFTN